MWYADRSYLFWERSLLYPGVAVVLVRSKKWDE